MRRMPRDYLRRNDARAGRTGDLAECYPAPGPKEGVGVKKTHNPDSVRHGFRDGGTRNMQDGGMMASGERRLFISDRMSGMGCRGDNG